jgi:hypothetical protein
MGSCARLERRAPRTCGLGLVAISEKALISTLSRKLETPGPLGERQKDDALGPLDWFAILRRTVDETVDLRSRAAHRSGCLC